MSTKKIYKDSIGIPEKIQAELENHTLKIKGEKGELQRQLIIPKVIVKKEDKIIIFTSKYASKRQKRIINTFKSHIKNMFVGVIKGFAYKLKICSGHFPMVVEVKNRELIVKNFYGEKIPRKAKILGDVKVTINGDEILVEGIDKELTGQTAANIERATLITKRDKRVFQDGIWLIERDGEGIK